jgi:hypothetical protein
MPTNRVVLDSLTEKIQQQGRFITELQAKLQIAREASVPTILGQLRLRGAVLLYVGHDVDTLIAGLDAKFPGHEAVHAVANSVFVLDNAPVAVEVRDAIRKATNGGMNRW